MASDGLRHQVFLKEEQQQQLEIAREIALIREITEQLRDAISRSDVTALESAIAGALQVPSACRSRRRDASAHHGAPCPPSPQVQLQDDLVGEAQQLLSLLQVSDVNCPLIATDCSFHHSRHVPGRSFSFPTGMQVLTTPPSPLSPTGTCQGHRGAPERHRRTRSPLARDRARDGAQDQLRRRAGTARPAPRVAARRATEGHPSFGRCPTKQ